jgi:predicted dehydrogenase
MVVVICKFENGMEGVMEFSGVALFETSDRLQVFGTQGMLSYDFSSDRITGGRLGEKDAAEIEISPEIEQRWRVEEDFIAAVRSPGSIQPQPSFALGVQYMRVVQAVADSVASGSEVQIVG